MKSTENSGNRIRGWFPKELFKFGFQVNMYSEWVSVGKFVKTIVGSISALALIVLAIAIWISISIQNALFAVIFLFPIIFLLVLYANYRGLKIRITSNELIVHYGLLNHKHIAISDITSCEQTKAIFGRYLGVGIRYGIDGSWAYSASFSNAVKINQIKGRPFVFSSNNPDAVCNAINQIKQAEA